LIVEAVSARVESSDCNLGNSSLARFKRPLTSLRLPERTSWSCFRHWIVLAVDAIGPNFSVEHLEMVKR
jgi:hypothetical protein